MFKFSLGTLFLVMAVVALGCAAIANSSNLWAEVMVTLVLAILFAGLLTALVGRGDARTFAIGFVAIGGAYFLLTFVEAAGLRNELLTSRAVNWLYALKQEKGQQPPADASGDIYGGMEMGMSAGDAGDPFGDLFGEPGMHGSGMGSYPGGMGMPAAFVSPAPPPLHDIGHALWTLVFGLSGGVLAQVIHRMSRRHESAD